MGYISTARNEIYFSPELPRYAVLGNSLIYKYLGNTEYSIILDAEYSTISGPEESFKAYWIEKEFKELVNEILKINPSTAFSGRIEIYGEESGDIWGLQVVNNTPMLVEPKLVWPEL